MCQRTALQTCINIHKLCLFEWLVDAVWFLAINLKTNTFHLRFSQSHRAFILIIKHHALLNQSHLICLGLQSNYTTTDFQNTVKWISLSWQKEWDTVSLIQSPPVVLSSLNQYANCSDWLIDEKSRNILMLLSESHYALLASRYMQDNVLRSALLLVVWS